jgi:hypothetical protein
MSGGWPEDDAFETSVRGLKDELEGSVTAGVGRSGVHVGEWVA